LAANPVGGSDNVHVVKRREPFKGSIALGGNDEGLLGLQKSSPGFKTGYVRNLDGKKLVFFSPEVICQTNVVL
jgi:hypothetical protein